MIDLPPAAVHERLIEKVPILLGRIDADAMVAAVEGSLPHESALGGFASVGTDFLRLFPDFDAEIRGALGGGRRRFVARQPGDDAGPCHFEVQLVFDTGRNAGAYFLIHDVTDVHRLQISLLECADREQRRVGQDLHDTIGQELTGIGFLVQNLRSRLAKGEAFDPELTDIQRRLADALGSARRIAWQLSPQLDGERLDDAFERLAAHLRETFSIDCSYESTSAASIADGDLAFNLYRIAQEACTNAVRHAAPTRIRIRLTTGDRNVLEIGDDGCGFDPSSLSRPGMGLSMMRFRANSIGGAIRIGNGDPRGTVVTCRFANRPPPDSPAASGEPPCVECSVNAP